MARKNVKTAQLHAGCQYTDDLKTPSKAKIMARSSTAPFSGLSWLHLRLTASSIYEFRNTAGRWPTAADDLASTSLPQISPYWKTLIENGTVVIAWRGDLKPNPKENAALVMTYNNAGLFSKQGRVWVCWGDLRTEYVKEEELRAKLPGSQAVRRE